jgi:dihydrodipicolinate synthase/N-acetylneuraminate lyase
MPAVQPLNRYTPCPGLSVPLITVLDRKAQVIEEEQREAVRFAIQNGAGADIIFAAGTTGEWDRLDNPRRQLVSRIAVEECRRHARAGRDVEAWVGVTGHTRAETLSNLDHALDLKADACVVAPLSIADVGDPAAFISGEIGALFQKRGRMMPVFLYDNAEIAAPGNAPHLHTRDVKQMARLDYVRGIKVTAGRSVLGNYMRAASHFKIGGEFAIYAGNPYLIFDLFAPPAGLIGTARYYWNRYLTQHALPYGVVAGPANAMPREWKRAWQVCRSGDGPLMAKYARVLESFRAACVFDRGGRPFRPTIACLKAALVEYGVCSSDAVAPATPAMAENERREFGRRFAELRRNAAEMLESEWISEHEARPAQGRAHQHA